MPAHPYKRTRGVRFNKDTQSFEMWCPSCATMNKGTSFWPITTEFWSTHYGLAKCLACHAESKRRAEQKRKAENRDRFVLLNKAYYQENRELIRWKQNQYKQTLKHPPNRPQE